MTPKRKTRMYEPWGYQDQNNYQGAEIIHENDLDSFFAGVEYKRDDNKIHFTNKDGDEVGSLNVNDFIKSDSIVEKTEYKDGILKVYFTNGDIITIDLTKLLDENEFKDGLIVDGHVVKVLVDGESERWLTVSANGVKVSGIQAEIDRLDGRIDDEIARASGEEARIEAKLDQEIQDRIDDVDAEETRATGEEARIEAKLDQEITRATRTEQELESKINTLNAEIDSEERRAEAAEQEIRTLLTKEINDRVADVNEEEARAKAAEQALQNAITAEEARATSAETELQGSIAEEGRRAQEAESALTDAIAAEKTRAEGVEANLAEAINGLNDSKFDDVVYDSSAKTITFYSNGNTAATIDTTDFVKDGMIDEVKIENDNLVIVFNTDSGKDTIEIPLTDIFDPSNYYTKVEINAKEATLLDDIDAETARAISAETDLQIAISGKADADTVYTQEEVDALIAEKEAEITQIKKDYNDLKEIVGEIGGNVEWGVPADGTFNNMMKKSGTVKLGEDTTTSTYAGGITSKNETTLNLNGKNLTFTGSTTNNPAIMTRGKQELTIMGKGTFDAGGRIAVEANGADTVINLSGTTGFFAAEPTYVTDRSGGELIYCYLGTINIYAGVFKNNGADKTFLLNCYDANYSAGTAKIVVYGGKFYDFDPSNAMSESGAPISYVADGYHVETSTDGDSTVYTVKKDS